MARLLIVDDETDICQLIQRFAEHEGCESVAVDNGADAVTLCRRQTFDLVILDVMMPGMDGFTTAKKIREEKDIPVLMLSARGEEYDKLMGFENGVDDYVVKPFSPRELMARVKVIVGRHKPDAYFADVLEFGGLCLNKTAHTVTVEGTPAELTAKEYDLLLYLMENRGIALSRDQIMDAVWGVDCFGDDRTVDWQIKLLRGKLGACRNRIVTIRGVGYKFEA